jgi:selenophosphate synthase
MADYYGVKESTFKDHFRHIVEIGRAKTKQKLMNAMLTNAIDKHNPNTNLALEKSLGVR